MEWTKVSSKTSLQGTPPINQPFHGKVSPPLPFTVLVPPFKKWLRFLAEAPNGDVFVILSGTECLT